MQTYLWGAYLSLQLCEVTTDYLYLKGKCVFKLFLNSTSISVNLIKVMIRVQVSNAYNLSNVS